MEMLLVIVIVFLSMGHCQECFVPGHCIDSDLLDHTFTENDRACLKDCQNVDECKWFSYDPQFNLCELFGNCLNRTTNGCVGCTSGETDCQSHQCQITGFCYGHLIQRTQTTSYNQCLTECNVTNGCAWFTFEQQINMCYMLTECTNLDETCAQCTSGEAGCPLVNEGYTKIIIATGRNDTGNLASVEVLDTSDDSLVCSDLPSYPEDLGGGTGGLLLHQPVICGGWGSDTCNALVEGKWKHVATMSDVRWYSASVVVGNSMLVMAGSPLLDTSDIIDMNTSKEGPKLPSGSNFPCAVALNETTIMIIGGQYQDLPRTTTYYYHLDIDHWIEGPSLHTGRYGHSCAAIKANDDQLTVVVVAGGYQEASVEVLPPGASYWSLGKSLPVDIHGGQLVPDSTGSGVYMIGGLFYTDGPTELDTIYHMACVLDCEWVKMRQTLKTARFFHIAIPVPDNLVTCQ